MACGGAKDTDGKIFRVFGYSEFDSRANHNYKVGPGTKRDQAKGEPNGGQEIHMLGEGCKGVPFGLKNVVEETQIR